jgi:hypothetical protein
MEVGPNRVIEFVREGHSTRQFGVVLSGAAVVASGAQIYNVIELRLSRISGRSARIWGMPQVFIASNSVPVAVSLSEVVNDLLVVFKIEYLSRGLATFHYGMKNVFYILDTKGYEALFTIPAYERQREPFLCCGTIACSAAAPR